MKASENIPAYTAEGKYIKMPVIYSKLGEVNTDDPADIERHRSGFQVSLENVAFLLRHHDAIKRGITPRQARKEFPIEKYFPEAQKRLDAEWEVFKENLLKGKKTPASLTLMGIVHAGNRSLGPDYEEAKHLI
jgi:hypothetical protein